MSDIQKPKLDQDVPTEKKTFMQVCKKWDRKIASAFGLLAFFTLIGIVIYNLIYAESSNCETRKGDELVDMLAKNIEPKCFGHRTNCRVNCSGINDDGEGLLAKYINDAVLNNKICEDEIEDLKLYSCNFQNETLKEGWLKGVEYDVKDFTIYGGNLKEIDENALSSSPFEWLHQLILVELNMTTLKNKYFFGMEHLDSFEFRWNEIRALHVEKNALEGMTSLTRISYSKVILDDEGLSNSFGCTGAKLDKLEILSLQYGHVEKLTACSFTNISGIKSIYLQNTDLGFIDKNAFEYNPNLHLLDLRYNNLITLENGTFDRIDKESGNVDVHLAGNSWNCKCSLQWLKDDLQKKYINETFPPLCNNKFNFKDMDFCSDKKCSVKADKEKCKINCSGIKDNGEGLLALIINEAIGQNENCKSEIDHLQFDLCNFQQNTLKEGWLKDVTADVKELTINGGNLNEIDEKALSSNPFQRLYKLFLIELKIKTLKRKYFLGMSSLISFEFRLNTIAKLHIEEYALEGMTLVNSISYSKVILDDDGLSNSFGCTGAKLSKLEILSLEHGHVEKLTACSFTNISSIKSIYLQSTVLEFIDKNAFQNNPNIRLLDLRQNNLKTLKNGTFDRLKKDSKYVEVNLGGNSWNCNCSLEWLKVDFLQKNYINKVAPPLCNNKDNFTDVDFCSAVSSTEHITPSSSTALPPISSGSPSISTVIPSTTIAEPRQMITVNCSVHEKTPIFIDAKVIDTHSVSVMIDKGCVHLEFREYSTDPLKVQVLSNVSLSDYTFLWYNSNNKNDFGCETSIQNSTILENLKQGTTYTFSVLKTCQKEVSPLCTFGLKTTAEWSQRLWIPNKYRTVIISVLTSCIVLIIILSILGTFLFIRFFPTLISGNKSVIVVKTKKDVPDLEQPKNYEKPVYWDPYLKPISQGYLTPKFHKYDKVKYRPPLTRSFSELSFTNNSSPYDDPRQIYSMRILQSRLQEQNAILRNRFGDFRPPLPPPNGRNRVHLEPDFDEESLYNSV